MGGMGGIGGMGLMGRMGREGYNEPHWSLADALEQWGWGWKLMGLGYNEKIALFRRLWCL